MRRVLLSGVAAGGITAVVFAALHHLLISDIWFSLIPMMLVAALCSACLAWSYRLLFAQASTGSWLRYNMVWLGALLLLGATSFVVFEPITTVAALLSAGGSPDELFRPAMPLTIAFTLAAVATISALWARSAAQAGAVLVTGVVLVALFGLNISVIGLVEMSGEGYRMLGMFFGLTAGIIIGNAAVFAGLERRGLFAAPDHATERDEATS
jgi:hypothetical protein